MEKSKKSFVFGIIALVLALICTFLPIQYAKVLILLGIVLAVVGIMKDSKKWLSISAIVLFVLMIAFDLMEKSSKANTYESIESVKNKTYSIKYAVKANSSFDVGYNNATGGMNHTKGVINWEQTIILKGTDFAYITAQNTEGGGTITVYIYVNGKLTKTASSTGEYSIADANCYPYKD